MDQHNKQGIHSSHRALKPSLVLACVVFAGILLQDTVHTYWAQGYGRPSDHSTAAVSIGQWPWFSPHVPSEVVEVIEDLPSDARQGILLVVNELAEEPHFTGNYIVGETVEDLFDNGPVTINPGDAIIYTTVDGQGNRQVVAITVLDGNTSTINTQTDLNRLIMEQWSGVNHVARHWVSTNKYSLFTGPVEYNGSLYLPIDGGATSNLPDNKNSWLELAEGLTYNPDNKYRINGGGWVVRYGTTANGTPRYYISTQSVEAGISPETTWAWSEVPLATAGTYASGAYVWTDDGGAPRFWRALTQTSTLPSVSAAEQGIWREFANGWIGTGSLSSHYFAHNTYAAGDTVIYGESYTFQYRYYRADKAVPANQPPLITVTAANGSPQQVVNTDYWTALN